MLSDGDRAILEFERGWWMEPGPKDLAIESVLGLASDCYYEHLIRIIGRSDAVRFDPLTVARVKAMIEPGPGEGLAVS